ncbi:MAG: DUF5979 domain-containing protein, partial [Acutalibacteraceae bacterium]|nr:DUF5979 domain-containing protein [Acutalibacteraceae bacterium]
KALECVSDNAHDNKLFLYHVVLKAPTGMEFVTSGSGSEHSGNVLTLTKVLGANAANYGVTNESPFTYRVKFNHANLASSPLTVTGTGNNNIPNPVNQQEYSIIVYPGTNVTISGMPDGTEYWVYENASTPTPDSIKDTDTNTVVSGDSDSSKIHGQFTSSDHEKTASITNNYPATGDVILKKALTADTPDGESNANLNKNFSITINFTAHDGAKFDPTQYTVTTSGTATVTSNLATTNDAKTAMSCTVSISKSDSTAGGVNITGLPAGTTYTVSENLSGSTYDNWKNVRTDCTSDGTADYTIASGENETATVINTLTGSLKLLKYLHTDSGTTSDNFSYTVAIEPPSGVNLDELYAIVGNSWTKMPDGEVTKTYLTKTFTNVPANAANVALASAASVDVDGLPYGTKYTVTENLASDSGYIKIGEEYGNTNVSDSKHYIGATGNTYTATNAKVNDLTLEKAFADGTPSSENYKLFVYGVQLTAPSGMKFVYDSDTVKLSI